MYLDRLFDLLQESLTTTIRFSRIGDEDARLRAQDSAAHSMGILKEVHRVLGVND